MSWSTEIALVPGALITQIACEWSFLGLYSYADRSQSNSEFKKKGYTYIIIGNQPKSWWKFMAQQQKLQHQWSLGHSAVGM